MKRTIYVALSIAVLAAFASCKPTLIENPAPMAALSENQLAQDLQIAQYDMNENKQYVSSPDGNYISYNMKGYSGMAFTRADDGTEKVYSQGTAGFFKFLPRRGSDPNQTLWFRAYNIDGTYVEVSKQVTVKVPSDLAPEILNIAGDNGSKKWMWHYDNGATCWGNAGNSGNGAGFTWNTVDGKWWGPDTPDGLMDQLSHAPGGAATGAESNGAYMIFSDAGDVAAYTADGALIKSGSFDIKDYNPSRPDGWSVGTLKVSEPLSILFPFSINEGGKAVDTFDIMYLDPNYMTLVYTKGNGAGSWGEITFWMFKNGDDYVGALNANDKRKWTWDGENTCWGNAGNSGAGAAFGPGVIDGKWWGVDTPEGLMDQLSHAPGGAATGAESSDAYMEFTAGGDITSYAGDGSVIKASTYEVKDYDATRKASGNWQLGKLVTKDPAILFPFSINEGGKAVTEFDLMYIDADHMSLVYTKGNGAGSWGEITFWQFKAINE